MKSAIFRPNDIRGIVDEDFTSEDFILIGQGYAKFLIDRGTKKAVVGRDNRIHSPKLQSAFMQGLLSSGIDVVDLGEVATPMVYFARDFLKIDGGACITASHNPSQWNGIKLCHGGGAIHEEEIYEVENNVRLKRFDTGLGVLTQQDITTSYLDHIKKKVDFDLIKRDLPFKKVGVDFGNGLGGKYVPGLFAELGLEIHDLHTESDGTFPNHVPDPSMGQNIKDLWHISREEKLPLSIAYDGDLDRLNAIDDQSVILWGDGLTIFFTRDVLERLPGSEILYDIMCSPAVPAEIGKHGGVSIMVPSGHAIVAHRLHRLKAPMAGEYSGHMYFQDGYDGYDDAIYATFRMLEILARKKVNLSEFMRDIPYYLSSGITNIPLAEEKKAVVISNLQKTLEEKYFLESVGGLRVKIDKTWAAIHPSGTESLIRIVVWGQTQPEIDKTRELLLSEINRLL